MFKLKIIIETILPAIDPEKPWNGHKLELFTQTIQESEDSVKERVSKIIKAVNDL